MPPTHYIDQINRQGVTIPISTVPPAGGVSNRRQNVARVRVPKDQAQSWRVILPPLVVTEPSPGMLVNFTQGLPDKPRAVVTFGTDGIQQEAIVDWPMGGSMFTVFGDSVVVDVVIPDQWIAGVAGVQVTTGGSITPNGTAGSVRPTRSMFMGYMGGFVPVGGLSDVIQVPNFAKAFRWHENRNNGSAAAEIQFFGLMDAALTVVVQQTPRFHTNGTVGAGSSPFTSSESTWPGPDGITLSPESRFLIFQNNADSGEDVGLTAEFILDLG